MARLYIVFLIKVLVLSPSVLA